MSFYVFFKILHNLIDKRICTKWTNLIEWCSQQDGCADWMIGSRLFLGWYLFFFASLPDSLHVVNKMALEYFVTEQFHSVKMVLTNTTGEMDSLMPQSCSTSCLTLCCLPNTHIHTLIPLLNSSYLLLHVINMESRNIRVNSSVTHSSKLLNPSG